MKGMKEAASVFLIATLILASMTQMSDAAFYHLDRFLFSKRFLKD